MAGIVIEGDPDERKRVVAVNLPLAAWEFLESEADFRRANLSAHVSDMLLCVLRVQGYAPSRESLSERQRVEELKL
jgi:hypothetical protein